MDAPLPSLPFHSGRGSPKANIIGQQRYHWEYTYARMNDTMAHAPLSSKGNIGIMTGDLPSRNACSHLHQLQVWWLLQCGGWVVCPDGLNGSLKPLLFDFKELPLWSLANVDESAWDPPMTEVDLGNAVPKVSPSTRAEDPHGLNLRGTLEQIQCASPTTPYSPLQYITSRTQTLSAVLGAPPSIGETKNSPGSLGTEPITPTPAAALAHTSPQATPPSNSPGSAQSTQQPFQLTGPKTPDAESTPHIKWPLATSKGKWTGLSNNFFCYRKKWTLLWSSCLRLEHPWIATAGSWT